MSCGGTTDECAALLARAAARRRQAEAILSALELPARWGRFGTPVLVGAVAHDLVVAPDIDMEVYCAGGPQIADGFEVLAGCAEAPNVLGARFANHLDGPDRGLYWQLRHKAAGGVEWKIDTWSLAGDHPGPLGRDLVEPLRRALTPEARCAILSLKERLLGDEAVRCPSVFLYEAVLDSGVRTVSELAAWLNGRATSALSAWRPSIG